MEDNVGSPRPNQVKYPWAMIIDVLGIQEFIYASNQLKENVGASHIIAQRLYGEVLPDILGRVFSIAEDDVQRLQQRLRSGTCLASTQQEFEGFEIGYIGGGNARIHFAREEDAVRFIQDYSLEVFARFPSIRIAYAMHDAPRDDFASEHQQLLQALSQNKHRDLTMTTYPKLGIIEECTHTGQVAEIAYHDEDDGKAIAAIVQIKRDSAEVATSDLNRKFHDIVQEGYRFTNEANQLGQIRGEHNYMAVVHIDGNRMGERFRRCRSVDQIRELSTWVQEANDQAFEETLRDIIHLRAELQKQESLQDDPWVCWQQQDQRTILPIRPILIGGDDITFLAVGKLGIFAARQFIAHLEDKRISDQPPLTACAGVCIVKTRYPFFRAYRMAEVLTQRAKMRSRSHRGVSYLDFVVEPSGFSGDLMALNNEQGIMGGLHAGPYRIGRDPIGLERLAEDAFQHIENTVQVLRNWPKNVVYAFRQQLFGDKEQAATFLDLASQHRETLKGSHFALKRYAVDGESRIWHDSVENRTYTYYYDSITLMDFLVPFCPKGADEGSHVPNN